MADDYWHRVPRIRLNERNLSIIVHSLFSSWMLAFLFEGQILYSLTASTGLATGAMVFGGIAAIFAGLVVCGFWVKSKKAAKRLFLCAYPFFIAVSALFFFSPSILWTIAIIPASFLAGSCVASWGIFLKSGTPKNERIKTVADMLIFSNVLMILLNMTAIHISPHVGLAFSMLMLLGAFAFALKLPTNSSAAVSNPPVPREKTGGIAGLLAFLCLFIVIITIDSGLMYEVVNPAFAGIEWLTSWYWALPYIAALLIMRNLPQKINRVHLLYVAIAMLGLSFIGFMSLDHTALTYLAVNTLMLGACGVYDLFWWSILGEMLEYHHNPIKIFGIGLSANVLGVLLGGLLGSAFQSGGNNAHTALLALTVVCVTLALLPFLNKRLSFLLRDHAYLAVYSELTAQNNAETGRSVRLDMLSERENQVASLLLEGKTNRMIAGELSISENTVKYYVKNIFSKYGIQSRAELIIIMLTSAQTPPQ